MRVKTSRDGDRRSYLTEVHAGLVLVEPKGHHNARRSRWITSRRGRTWLLPVMRVVALAVSMLCLSPTGGMGTGMSMKDAWSGGSNPDAHQYHQSHSDPRAEHVVFVGVPEESAVLPLKALAREMMARGFRASLALPQGFDSWVEDIPGLTFLALNGVSVEPNTSAGPGLFESNTLPSDPTVESVLDTGPPPSSACHRSWRGRGTAPCNRGKGLGDAWGGGVGGGWGAGLGLWRGLRGSLVGASEFLGHLKAYLGFYHRKEAAMYTPLVESFRRDPPALVVADRRALAAFRACYNLGLRCVVNSAGLLGDLDRPPKSIPAPYTGFPMEGQTIGQRLHSTLIRLVLSLSRLQAARDAGNPVAAKEHPFFWASGRIERDPSSSIVALGNTCFGGLEYPRELPPKVHMVGPLWMSDPDSEPRGETILSPGCGSRGSAVSSRGRDGGCSDDPVRGSAAVEGEGILEDVWAWLEPKTAAEEDTPVVVVQLAYGGGAAWGVSPDAAVAAGGDEKDGELSWKAFREETLEQLSAIGCRTLWLDHGRHPDSADWDTATADNGEVASQESSQSSWKGFSHPLTHTASPAGEKEGSWDRKVKDKDGSNKEGWREKSRNSLVLDVEEAFRDATVGSSELLVRVMSHHLVTVLVTDGDVRSLQAAMWHGKPSVVLPTSPDQREAAARLGYSGAGVTCDPPCGTGDVVSAIVKGHHPDRRRAALRSSVVLREAGGVSRAGNMLENELWTHLAATARRAGCPYGDDSSEEDIPVWCSRPGLRVERGANWAEEWTQAGTDDAGEDWHEDDDLNEEEEELSSRGAPSLLSSDDPEGLSWYPDDPEWVWNEMSWVQRHLVDVYAIYGALVMGVGLLMKLTWNLVWSLCDITTAPASSRGGLGSMDHTRSPSPSPGKDNRANGGGNDATGGKLGRGVSSKWGSGGGAGGGGAGGKKGSGGKHHGNASNSAGAHHAELISPAPSGGKYAKRMALTNGH